MPNLPVFWKSNDPFTNMQRLMSDTMAAFLGGVPTAAPKAGSTGLKGFASTFNPDLDVTVSDTEMHVSAELPGIDEKDVQLTVDRDTLTISGEKRYERKGGDKDQSYVERSYGSFQRVLSLPFEVDREKVEASFKKGVLDVRLPKTAAAKNESRRISIKGG